MIFEIFVIFLELIGFCLWGIVDEFFWFFVNVFLIFFVLVFWRLWILMVNFFSDVVINVNVVI